jgi:hypothetical protein
MAKTEIIQLSAVTDAGMLRDAAKLVRQGWTQGYSARTEVGHAAGFDWYNAVCFCAAGAVSRAIMDGLGGHPAITTTHLFHETEQRLFECVVEVIKEISPGQPVKFDDPGTHIAEWNDSWARDQNTVVAVLDKAATLALASTTKNERD